MVGAEKALEPAKVPSVSRVIGLDLRSLGLWRIALGLVLLIDWLTRSFHFRAHYTAEGILPLRAYLNLPDLSVRLWSVFYLNDAPWFVGLLFALGTLSALALTLGYRTAWSGWIAWVLLVSLHHRNPLVLTKGDSYLSLLIFWGNFLPWGKAFSLDGGVGEDLARPHQSVAGVAYLFQVCFLYWFTALLRTGPSWQVDGSALYLSYNLESLVKEPAYMMLGLGPQWLSLFTFWPLAFEVFGPFLLLLPWAWTRVVAVGLIIFFHLGIHLTLELSTFAWVCMAGPLGLLPSRCWQLPPGRGLEKALGSGFARLAGAIPLSLSGYRPPSLGLRWRSVGQILPALALLAVSGYLWCDLKGYSPNGWGMRLTRVAGLSQSWGMFSPSPPTYDGWQSIEARCRSGLTLDLITRQPYPAGQYQGQHSWVDQRWGIYRERIRQNGFGNNVNLYLRYLVARWDQQYPENPIVAAEYIWHARATLPDYLLPEYSREVMARYQR
jgi:hypothetical protein